MTECCGLIGWVFGHNFIEMPGNGELRCKRCGRTPEETRDCAHRFIEYEVERIPPQYNDFHGTSSVTSDVVRVINSMTTVRHVVACKWCGREPKALRMERTGV